MKIKDDKYYTEVEVARRCVETTFSVLGSEWDRVIEPAAGAGSFLRYLPPDTLAYDIKPDADGIIQADYRDVRLPFIERSLVIGNPPFGRANKLSVQFVKVSMAHSPYVSFIQPISQLGQNRTMKDTELLHSEDIGTMSYSGRYVHCCLNIYHRQEGGHRQKFDVPGIIECRHIFRSGKYKHPDTILDYPWDFRVAAWGRVRLLHDGETCPNEVVFRCDDNIREWLRRELERCPYDEIVSSVTTPNLPAWRLKKWLHEEWTQEHSEYGDDGNEI